MIDEITEMTRRITDNGFEYEVFAAMRSPALQDEFKAAFPGVGDPTTDWAGRASVRLKLTNENTLSGQASQVLAWLYHRLGSGDAKAELLRVLTRTEGIRAALKVIAASEPQPADRPAVSAS